MSRMWLGDFQQPSCPWLAHEKDPQGWHCWMWRVWSEGARPQEAQGDPSQVRANWLESWWMSISFIFVCRRFKIYSCPHCSDKYCTQEDLERHLLKVWKKTHEMDLNAKSLCEDALVTFVKTCSTSGGEEQHSQRSTDCIRSTERATESTPGKTYCSATGEFLQLAKKHTPQRTM